MIVCQTLLFIDVAFLVYFRIVKRLFFCEGGGTVILFKRVNLKKKTFITLVITILFYFREHSVQFQRYVVQMFVDRWEGKMECRSTYWASFLQGTYNELVIQAFNEFKLLVWIRIYF